jgi:hypothetical protein
MLAIPSTVAKAVFTSVPVSRRIGVPSIRLDPRNVLISGDPLAAPGYQKF